MNDLRDSNPYELKTQKDEGYLYEAKPAGYLTALEVNFTRKLVTSVLSKKRSSQLNKLLKIN